MTEEQKKIFTDIFENSVDCQINSKNKITYRRKDKKQYVTKDAILDFIIDTVKYIPNLRDIPRSELDDWLDNYENSLKEKNSPKKIAPLIPEIGEVGSFLFEILNAPESAIKLNPRGDMITFLSNGVRVQATEKTVLSYANIKAQELGLSGVYKRELIKDGWELLSKHYIACCITYLQNKIKYNPDANQTLANNFIKYIYDYLQIAEDYDIFEMLFKHWMWSLKRRIFGKKVVWHIWINFCGAQGIGKSELITRMLSFMTDFVTDADIGAIQDVSREIRKFTDYFIIFFDELKQGANKDNTELQVSDAVVDMIKGIMTQEVFTVRILGTQSQNKFTNTFVPISCANKHLYDIIYDGEAMRRWFEFRCQRDKPPSSYEELNKVLTLFPKVLSTIDENNEDGYWIKGSETDKKIVDIQKHYVPTNTSTNEWINKCNIKPDLNKNPANIFTSVIYSHYKDYCRAVGRGVASMSRVEMILRRTWPDACDENNVYLVECDVMDPTNNTLVHKEDEPKVFTSEDKIATFETPMDDIDWGL